MNITKLGTLIGDWSNVNNELLQKIKNLFNLTNSDIVLDIQKPSEISMLTTDDLEHYNTEYPYTVKRIIIHLTDYKSGHFYCFDNEIHTDWKAGDVYAYDWRTTSYASANAGETDRNILVLTGVISIESNEFLARLKRFDTYTLDLKENTW